MSVTKNIIVTGATGNIGAKLSQYLANKGYNLILVARDENKLKALQGKIKMEYGVSVNYISLDFNDNKSLSHLIALCNEVDGGIHGLVLMPPKILPTPSCFPSDEKWGTVFKQTFIHPLAVVKELIPCFNVTQTSAKVVIISGISSAQPLINYATNNVIRLAWLGQTKTMALCYADRGIHFNTLSLGGVMTDTFIEKLKAEAEGSGLSYGAILEERVSNIPLKKYASLDNVSVMIECLLSEFSNHITGTNIMCDGGFIKAY